MIAKCKLKKPEILLDSLNTEMIMIADGTKVKECFLNNS